MDSNNHMPMLFLYKYSFCRNKKKIWSYILFFNNCLEKDLEMNISFTIFIEEGMKI